MPPAPVSPKATGVLSLKQICERAVASHCDMKNAVSVLAHAEVLDSPALANYALEFLMRNLDGVLTLGRPADLDFLLEDEADGINQMIQERQQQLAIKGASQGEPLTGGDGISSSPQPSASNPTLSSSPALTSHASTLIGKISKGREPSLEEAIKWERGLKKRMAQIEDLEKAQAQGTRLSRDQVAKVSRKDVVLKELATLGPVLNRLNFVHSARQSRVKSSSAVEEEEDLLLLSPEPELFDEAEMLAMNAEETVKPFGLQVCELCKVTCTTQEGWDEHIMGKRHKKRMTNVAALEAQSNPSRQDQDPSPCPWLSKKVPGKDVTDVQESPVVPESPSNTKLGPSSIPLPPAKSFREILAEEERAATAQISPGFHIRSRPSPRKTPDIPASFPLQLLGSPHIGTSPSTMAVPQSTSPCIVQRATPSPQAAMTGSLLLSDFIKPKSVTSKKPLPKGAGSTAPWAIKKTPESPVIPDGKKPLKIFWGEVMYATDVCSHLLVIR